MTPEEQRIAIAGACGWKFTTQEVWKTEGPHFLVGGIGEQSKRWIDYIPDYLNDLNAMHEAEKILACATEDDPKPWESYMRQLSGLLYEELPQNLRTRWQNSEVFGEWLETTASAAQRAEVFLKTIGKWKES